MEIARQLPSAKGITDQTLRLVSVGYLWLLMLFKECVNVFYKFRALNCTGMTGAGDDLILCARKGLL
jgi:hypothetical protein